MIARHNHRRGELQVHMYVFVMTLPATLRTALSAGSRERMQSGWFFCHSSNASLSMSILDYDTAQTTHNRIAEVDPVETDYKIIMARLVIAVQFKIWPILLRLHQLEI